MSQTESDRLERLLTGLEEEVAANARRAERRALWAAARQYRRSRPWLEDLLPSKLLALALRDLSTPSVTWRVLRHLCRHIRFNGRARLGSLARLRRCRTIAAGETLLLARQRIARRDRRFPGALLNRIGRAV